MAYHLACQQRTSTSQLVRGQISLRQLVRSWFEAGSKLVRSCFESDSVMEFGFEPASNQLRASQCNGIRLLVDRFLQRAAMLALQALYQLRQFRLSVRLSVPPSVRLSVTRQYCVKTTARSTVQFALLDSKMRLVLQKPKNIPQGRPLPPEILAQSDIPPLDSSEF